MGKNLFIIFLFFIVFFNLKIYGSDKISLNCINTENYSTHNFVIYPNYKVVNILPNGYEFDYIIEQESSDLLISYFYQIRDNFIKKFVLSFNFKENILYDEMYEGIDKKNLTLKDKKIFKCKE